jgi:hypothetical protein
LKEALGGQSFINPFSDLACDNVSDKPSVAFKEGQFVGEYTFQKNAYAEVACDIRRRDEHGVLRKPEVSQMDCPRRGSQYWRQKLDKPTTLILSALSNGLSFTSR